MQWTHKHFAGPASINYGNVFKRTVCDQYRTRSTIYIISSAGCNQRRKHARKISAYTSVSTRGNIKAHAVRWCFNKFILVVIISDEHFSKATVILVILNSQAISVKIKSKLS